MKLKECSKCLIPKPETMFHAGKSYKDKLYPVCKPCHAEWYKEYVQSIKDNGPHIHRDSKTCARCHRKMPISQFGVRRSSPDGRMSYCKPCWSGITAAARKRRYL